MNLIIENYVRCYCSCNQNKWDYPLPSAEFSYNYWTSDDKEMYRLEVDIGYVP